MSSNLMPDTKHKFDDLVKGYKLAKEGRVKEGYKIGVKCLTSLSPLEILGFMSMNVGHCDFDYYLRKIMYSKSIEIGTTMGEGFESQNEWELARDIYRSLMNSPIINKKAKEKATKKYERCKRKFDEQKEDEESNKRDRKDDD